MKLKKAFTLAEVLITLAIIGIVAALVAPTLAGMYQKTKVGPTLKRFITTMENANELMLGDNESNSLGEAFGQDANGEMTPNASGKYFDALEKYVIGDATGGATSGMSSFESSGALENVAFKMKDGLEIGRASGVKQRGRTGSSKGSYKGDYALLGIDINGSDQKPNKRGIDIFYFYLDNGGSLIPYGGQQAIDAGYDSGSPAWKSGCSETSTSDMRTCAGSIADNDWKIIYKY